MFLYFSVSYRGTEYSFSFNRISLWSLLWCLSSARGDNGMVVKSIVQAGLSQRQAALVAGNGLLLMTVLTIFGDVFVFRKLLVQGDAMATANNIIGSLGLFRAGVGSLLVVFFCDLAVAWALYVFFAQVNRALSFFMAVLRLVYAGVLCVALLSPLKLLWIAGDGKYPSSFDAVQMHSQALQLLNAFYDMWGVGMIIFGLHLLALGYLVLKTGYIPVYLGVLLIVAGLAYPVSDFAEFLFPGLDASFIRLFGLGELLFMFWLLLKGGEEKQLA